MSLKNQEIRNYKKIEGYTTYAGVTCLISSVANVLKLFDARVTDEIIFFLGNGFKLSYSIENVKNVFDIILRHKPIDTIESFFNRTGIPFSLESNPGMLQNMLTAIEQNMQNNYPIIAWTDLSLLKYHKISVNEGSPHAIVIIGISGEGVHVSDCFVPQNWFASSSTLYEGIIPFDELEAWETFNYLHYEIDYKMVEAGNIKISEDILITALRENLSYYFSGENSNQKMLLAFAENLENFDKFFSVEDIIENFSSIGYKIRYYGIIFSRIFLKLYLELLETRYNFDISNDYTTLIDTISKKWNGILLLTLKCGHSKDYRKILNKMSDKIKEIVDLESRCFEKLYQEAS